jgi:hypothetical protein
MINNSFLYQYTEGDYWRLWTRKTATLIYFRSLAEWGGGGFCIKYLIYLLS